MFKKWTDLFPEKSFSFSRKLCFVFFSNMYSCLVFMKCSSGGKVLIRFQAKRNMQLDLGCLKQWIAICSQKGIVADTIQGWKYHQLLCLWEREMLPLHVYGYTWIHDVKHKKHEFIHAVLHEEIRNVHVYTCTFITLLWQLMYTNHEIFSKDNIIYISIHM